MVMSYSAAEVVDPILRVFFGVVPAIFISCATAPFIALYVNYLRSNDDFFKFIFDIESWNFGHHWTQISFVAACVAGQKYYKELSLPVEDYAKETFKIGEYATIIFENHPAALNLLVVIVAICLCIAALFFHLGIFRRLRGLRPHLTHTEGQPFISWQQWLRRGSRGHLLWRRRIEIGVSWLMGGTAVICAYKLFA
jgi:hypothetical protein